MVSCALVLACVGSADASWGTTTTATGAARASTITPAAAPNAVVSGVLLDTVSVTWPSATFANGATVTAYTVHRYDALTGLAGSILTGCTGTIQATSCIETLVPPGQWKYAVTAVAGNWHTTESAKSNTVTTL